MKYLNLTEGFNPCGAYDDECIQFESFFFNGGEPHIRISKYDRDDVVVTTRVTSMNDFMMLIIALDALYGLGTHETVNLFIPYFPASRQDRIMNPGESLSVKVFADILANYNLNLIQTFDNHSDVTAAVVTNCEDMNNHDFVKNCINLICNNFQVDLDNITIVSPDAGSNKKIKDLMVSLNHPCDAPFPLVKCDKTRNVVTGSITGFEVYSNDLQGKDCVIVDDICDGGGTFIGLSKELKAKGAGDIYLIVSHGIFSKPLKELKPYFKKIYTTDSWRSKFNWEEIERDCADLVEIIKLNL